MGFIVTPPTAVPVDGDGSQDQESWGEGTGTFATPPEEALGHPGSSTLSSNSVNFNAQKSGRISRSTVDRMARSDEGFLSSCVLHQGDWNLAGGTLDVTLEPSRVVVDYSDDGGVAMEIKAIVGETLAANSDVYLNLNEAGAFELQTVPNDDPAPVPTAGFVTIWILVTDGVELDDVLMGVGVAPFPCLAHVGARSLFIEVPTLGGKAADPVTVIGTMTVAEVATFDAGIKGTGAAAVTLTEGAILPANKSALGDVTTAMQAGTLTALADVTALGKVTSTNGYDGVAGTAAVLLQGARYVAGSAPGTLGQTSFNAAGEFLHHNGDHVRSPGARASARQEATTGAAQVTTTMQTGKRQTAPVSLDVTVNIYVQRSVPGTVTMTIEEDNGVDGGGQVWSTLGNAFVTPQLAGSFLLVQFTRVRTADATDRYFRLRADSGGGTTQVLEEGHLEVRPID